MKRTAIFFTILALCCCFPHAYSQVPTTQGKEFWLTFMNNYNQSSPALSLIISSKNGATGTISNPRTGYSLNFTCPPLGRIDVPLTVSECYCLTEGVQDKALLVESSDTISVYASNFYVYTYDATGVLPVEALGDEHMIQTWTAQGECAVIAIEDGTEIESSCCGLLTLDRGQVYFCKDGTVVPGSTFTAKNCRKIAVFAGNQCTNTDCSACDHIVEQIWPTWSWGKNFVAVNCYSHSYEQVRVTAATEGTNVYVDGNLQATLSAGGYCDFNVETTPIYITADNPVSTFIYVTHCGSNDGDPAMVWLSPVEQNIKEVTFGTFDGSGLTQYVNIVIPTGGVPSIKLDGISISSDFSVVPSNVNYSYARKNITHDTHTLTCDSGFVAYVYGLGDYESYAYSAGSTAANLKSQMFVNDVNSVYIPNYQEYCYGDTIDFRAIILTEYDGVSWDFGDGTTGVGDTCPHYYEDYGIYSVDMIVDRRSANNNCGDFDTINSTVRIFQYDTTFYADACVGFTYDSNGFYVDSVAHDTLLTNIYPTMWGCDSIVRLQIRAFSIPPVEIEDHICEGLDYHRYDFDVEGKPVGEYDYSHFCKSSEGCDSTTQLHLYVDPNPEPYLDSLKVVCLPSDFPVVIDPGQFAGYLWNTGDTTEQLTVGEPGIYTVMVTFDNGCTANSAIAIELHDEATAIVQGADFCDDFTTTLHVETAAPNMEWSTGETTTDISVDMPGYYSVTVSDQYCQTSTHITIEECPFELIVPNVYTPNGDGSNDCFEIEYADDFPIHNFKSFSVHVYDRWGRLMFKSEDPRFKWDGTKATGSPASDGVYYWVITFEPKVGTYHELHGSVTRLSSK